MGDTLWTHTYQKIDTQSSEINTIIPLADGRIVVGAMSTYDVTSASSVYNHDTPWFLLLDSAGSIIRDTLYGGNKYGGDGRIFKDSLGSYIHIGQIDSLAVPSNVNDYANFPNYIAHLDTDFRIEWITRFDYSAEFGHRYAVKVIQLHDGNYVLAGDVGKYPQPMGWAAKVDRSGNILWNHYYTSDSTHDAHFRDVAEKPDGSLVFTGATFNDTLPAWHQGRDVWLIGTDSNGCELPGCGPDTSITKVQPLAPPASELKVWPNPTAGAIIVSAPGAGVFILYNMLGQQVATYKIKSGETAIQMPAGISAGVYVCQYMAAGNDKSQEVVRLVYQP